MTSELTVPDARLALRDVHGPLVDLLQKLNGTEGDMWNEALRRMLRKENPWEAYDGMRKVVRTGVYANGHTFLEALRRSKIMYTQVVGEMLDRVPLTRTPTDVELRVIPLSMLGFTSTVIYKDLCARVKEKGYTLCSIEEATAFRLEYTKQQPLRKGILVAMEPFEHGNGSKEVLCMGRDTDGVWLSAHDMTPHYYRFDAQWLVLVKVPR